MNESSDTTKSKTRYNRFLLLVAGLGGLLYGVDVGIIAGALPYLQATSGFSAGQLSFVVAAVLLGSVISTLFAGLISDWMGRKRLMIVSGILFVISIPMIALAHGYGPLVAGRLLQGISAGFIGVVVPLYLAECLGASNRGKGTGIFQWLLTLGIMVAAGIGLYFSFRVGEIKDPEKIFAFKDAAWRSIFWVSMPPGVLFVIGSFLVAESPRWLFRRGKVDAARAALLRSRTEHQANVELKEMEQTFAAERAKATTMGQKANESLWRRKYIIPFLLACVILACNQSTGVNSIIGYNADILIQAGLSDFQAHLGYVIFTFVNFLLTFAGVMLVDRRGRKFLLSVGSAGIIVSLICVGLIFRQTEKLRVDCSAAVQAQVSTNQTLTLAFNQKTADSLLAAEGAEGKAISERPSSLVIIYSYGGFQAATAVVRSDAKGVKPIVIKRSDVVPAKKLEALASHPFANYDAATKAPLKIDAALVTPVPTKQSGRLVELCLVVFMAFFAVGPGVCVWLALSELMPTRIRSNGMSIALLINQSVSTTIAAMFLPVVGKYGYSTVFFVFAGFTVIYFITATFLLPETRGKTLEEIEKHFQRGGKEIIQRTRYSLEFE
jgi:sugar porter (SP) family MFS transporter